MGTQTGRSRAQRAGLWIGAALFVLLLWLPAPDGFSLPAWRAAALAALMAIWWATEALPIAATSMLPLAAGPLLGIADVESAGYAYGSSTIFLILGGCFIALALERWNLHRRIAYTILGWSGSSAEGLVFGVMAATAFVSMWVSNTSTTLMMLPVAASLAALVVPDLDSAPVSRRNFSTAIVVGVAYAATIGGLGTLIGSPTNALASAFLQENHGIRLGFAEWLRFGLPCVFLLLPLAWWLLVRVSHRFEIPDIAAARDQVRVLRAALGPPSPPERRVALIGLAAAVAWVASPWLKVLPGLVGLSDMGIAMLAALALYLVPAGGGQPGMLLSAAEFRRVPWDTLFLFGGGLALAALIQDSGLSVNIGQLLAHFAGWPPIALTLVVVIVIIFWTELCSNVATAATFLPILAAMAMASDIPLLQLVVPAAIAASCGFMLPVGTAPNAIVYGSGRVGLRDMMRAGLLLDILAAGVVVAVATVVVPGLS